MMAKPDPAPVQGRVIDADAALDGRGVVGVGQVAGLGPLDLLDVLDRLEVPAVVARSGERLLAPGAPQVAVPHVVVVGDRDRGRVADHVAEVAAELQPVGIVPVVVVDLVAGEEQQVGLDPLEVLDDVALGDVAAVARIDRVARERGHHDLVLVDRVAADDALVHGRLAVPHPVRHFAGHVPVLDAKRRRPAGIDHLGRGDLLPLAVLLHFQPHGSRIALFQRVELGGELEDVVVDRVQGEADHLVLGDLRDLQQSGPPVRRAWVSASVGERPRPRWEDRRRKQAKRTRSKWFGHVAC